MIADETFLFFFDNCDSLEENAEFISFIEDDLIMKCPKVKVLLTCRKNAMQRGTKEESSGIELTGLKNDKPKALSLFLEYSGWLPHQ